MLRDFLTPVGRKRLYFVFAVVAVTIGATQTAYSALPVETPTWLTVVVQVFSYLAVAVGFTAAGNTPTTASEAFKAIGETAGVTVVDDDGTEAALKTDDIF